MAQYNCKLLKCIVYCKKSPFSVAIDEHKSRQKSLFIFYQTLNKNIEQLGFYAEKYKNRWPSYEKWRLPNPPRFIRCICVIIKYTTMPVADYLQENGHIFKMAAFNSFVHIYVDLKVLLFFWKNAWNFIKHLT